MATPSLVCVINAPKNSPSEATTSGYAVSFCHIQDEKVIHTPVLSINQGTFDVLPL